MPMAWQCVWKPSEIGDAFLCVMMGWTIAFLICILKFRSRQRRVGGLCLQEPGKAGGKAKARERAAQAGEGDRPADRPADLTLPSPPLLSVGTKQMKIIMVLDVRVTRDTTQKIRLVEGNAVIV